MDISTPTVLPLRQRMLDDMRMRKMAEHTQDGYIRAVRKRGGAGSAMLVIEAIRLVHRLEQDHEHLDSHCLAVAPTHARRRRFTVHDQTETGVHDH